MYVEYSTNNSGGRWWLSDKNWTDLEAAGWIVAWNRLFYDYDDKGEYVVDERGIPVLLEDDPGTSRYGRIPNPDEGGRWLGSLAQRAYRPGLSLRDAAREWERVTGLSSTEAGCPCCGQPHNFYEYDDSGSYVASGPSIVRECEW